MSVLRGIAGVNGNPFSLASRLVELTLHDNFRLGDHPFLSPCRCVCAWGDSLQSIHTALVRTPLRVVRPLRAGDESKDSSHRAALSRGMSHCGGKIVFLSRTELRLTASGTREQHN